MERLTKDDVNQMGMVDLSHNQVFVRNREAWYRDFETEISARDLAKAIFARNGIEYPEDDEFDEYMLELLQDGYETIDGMIALYYNALWSMAEIREQLKEYEDLEEQGLLIKLPCKVGDIVYKVNKASKRISSNEIIKINCDFSDDIHFTIEFIFKNYNSVFYHHFGETVFLTKEAAEKELERLKGAEVDG